MTKQNDSPSNKPGIAPDGSELIDDLTRLIVAPVPGVSQADAVRDDKSFRESIDSDCTNEQDRALGFIHSRIHAYAGLSGLLDLRARASAYTRPFSNEYRWVCLDPETDSDDLMHDAAEEATGMPQKIGCQEGSHAWRVLVRVGPASSPGAEPFGLLSAVFDDEQSAQSAVPALNMLSGELALILRVLRRGADRSALVRLAAILSDPGERGEVLDRMAYILEKKMRSDGVRVYVARLWRGRPCLERLYCSVPLNSESRDRHRIGTKQGLTDWVTRNNKCILISRPVIPPNVGIEPELALTDEGEFVEIVAHPEAKEDDSETGMCLAPLRIDGSAMGAFIVWREKGQTYNSDSDLFPLAHYAAMIAAGARWRISREATRNKADEISMLGEIVSAAAPFAEVFDAVAAGVGRLAHTARTLVLRFDAEAKAYYSAGAWTDPELEHEGLPRIMIRTKPSETPPDGIASAIASIPELCKAGECTLSVRRILTITPEDSSKDVVVLLDEAREPHEVDIRTFDDDLGNEIPRTYLNQVGAILYNHVRTLAQSAVEQFSEHSRDGSTWQRDNPEQVLAYTPEVLRKSLGCDAVLVYNESAEGVMRVTMTSPQAEGLISLGVAPGSLTDLQIKAGEPRRILDVNDEPEKHNLNREVLGEIAQHFGWKGIRSWVCYPVSSSGRCVGVLKLLTRSDGRFLGPSHMLVAQSVAARASWEMQQIARSLALQSINDMATRLASMEGEELSKALTEGLVEIIGRAVGFPSEVLLTATITSKQPRTFAWSPGISEETKNYLETLSQDQRHIPNGTVGDKLFSVVPVSLPGDSPIWGHLFVVARKDPTSHEMFVVSEAAREIAVLLDRERRRHVWKRQVGIFRHAVLGPVQGLTTAGRKLHKRANELGGEPDELKRLKSTIEAEAEAVRLWRVNQRLFFSEGKFAIQLQLRPLRPLLDACVDRYREVYYRRGMNIECKWEVEPSYSLQYDYRILDVALSNLLDNAGKYGFFNRTVMIGTKVVGTFIHIWVEDEGHIVPPQIEGSIYEFGVRSEQIDPIRSIDGTGLGLPMVKRIAQAHDGDVFHSCIPIGQDREDPDHPQPHRVKFTIKLPAYR